MSIRPLDHNVMIPKTQEIGNMKQIENTKNRNNVESGFIQQEKIIEKNKKKVLDTEKTSYNKIKDEENSKNQPGSQEKKRDSHNKFLSEEEINDPNKGNKIDIRI